MDSRELLSDILGCLRLQYAKTGDNKEEQEKEGMPRTAFITIRSDNKIKTFEITTREIQSVLQTNKGIF